MKGHFIPHSEETKKKISLTKTGVPSTKKGKKFPQYSGENSKIWKGGKPKCPVCFKRIDFYAKTCLKHRNMEAIVKKMVEVRKNKGNYVAWNKGLKGFKAKEKHWNWQGGITPINNKIRGSLEYKLWQDSVFSRDNYRCKNCNEYRIKQLVAHHILNFSNHVELRLAIDNGVTLCRLCHKEFHKKYSKKNNSLEQLTQFLTK